MTDEAADTANEALAPTAVAVMEYLARAVVEDADAVKVEVAAVRDRKVRISVFAAPNDFGRLIEERSAQRGLSPIHTPTGTQIRLARAISTTTRTRVMKPRPNTRSTSAVATSTPMNWQARQAP